MVGCCMVSITVRMSVYNDLYVSTSFLHWVSVFIFQLYLFRVVLSLQPYSSISGIFTYLYLYIHLYNNKYISIYTSLYLYLNFFLHLYYISVTTQPFRVLSFLLILYPDYS